MDYVVNRYFCLLKQEKILQKQGEFFYEVNREDYLELLRYQIQLQNHKYWENRQKYFSVISDFLNGINNGEDFSDEFFDLWRKDRDRDITKITKMYFEPDPISEGFSSLIRKVFSCCESFEPETNEEQDYNEKWLKNSIEEIFSEMLKYF